jgi:hypothetical protein
MAPGDRGPDAEVRVLPPQPASPVSALAVHVNVTLRVTEELHEHLEQWRTQHFPRLSRNAAVVFDHRGADQSVVRSRQQIREVRALTKSLRKL